MLVLKMNDESEWKIIWW